MAAIGKKNSPPPQSDFSHYLFGCSVPWMVNLRSQCAALFMKYWIRVAITENWNKFWKTVERGDGAIIKMHALKAREK